MLRRLLLAVRHEEEVDHTDYGMWALYAPNVGRARARCQVSTAEPGPRRVAAALSLQRSDAGCYTYCLQTAVRHRMG